MNYSAAFVPSISTLLRPTFSKRLFWLFALILFAVILVSYVAQVNSFTGAKYLLKNYQVKVQVLSREREGLEINFSRANSLSNIEGYISTQGFERIQKQKYIQILEDQVAKR